MITPPKCVLVTLSIRTGAVSQDTLQMIFDNYPTMADIRTQVGEDRFKGLLDQAEVEDIEDYSEEFIEEESIIFECRDDAGKPVGAITLEQLELLVSTMAEITG